jgi:hypothetical protein
VLDTVFFSVITGPQDNIDGFRASRERGRTVIPHSPSSL